MEQNIGELIQIALLGTNNQQRPIAEQQLRIFMETNPTSFLVQCGEIISNEQVNKMLRQAAGTLIKRITTLNDKKDSAWNLVSQNHQEQVKKQLLQTLITKDQEVQRAAALAIASICTNEFPKNKWQELIPLMANNLNHQDVEIKKTAILTLGYICEQLKIFNQVNFLEKDKIEAILMGILLGMSNTETNQEVTLLAIKALQASLQFMSHLFDDDRIRNYMLNLLVPLCNHQSKQIKIQSLQCMMDIIKQLYQHLNPYVLIFFQNLSPLCLEKDTEISVPAIEIWNTLANEDLERKQHNKSLNHLLLCQKQLVQILLQNLLLANSEEEEEDEQNTKLNSYKCLLNVVETVGDEVLSNFIPFISNTIANQDNLYKQASLMAFSALVVGTSELTIRPILKNSFLTILQLIQEDNLEIKKWTCICLSKIAEVYPDIIMNLFDKILPVLLQNLNTKPEISKQICSTFFSIGEYLDKVPKTHYFFQNFETIIENLINLSFVQNQDVQLIDQAFTAVVNLLKNQGEQKVCLFYLQKFLQMFSHFPQNLNPEQKNTIKRGLSTGIHQCLFGMEDIQDQNLVQNIYEMVINEFKQLRDVSDDGLYIIIGLIERSKQNFSRYLPEFYGYIKHALEKSQEKDVFKAVLNLILSLTQYLSSEFIQQFNEIMTALIVCLNKNDFDIWLKIDIFQFIGDSSLNMPKSLTPFLEQITSILNLAMQNALEFQKSSDELSIEYSEQLKEVLIQSYTCLLDAMSDQPQKQHMFLQVQVIVEFVRLTCDRSLNPTVEYYRNSLALISDIARCFGNQVTGLVKQQFVQEIIQSLEKFKHIQENMEIIQYAIREISKLK